MSSSGDGDDDTTVLLLLVLLFYLVPASFYFLWRLIRFTLCCKTEKPELRNGKRSKVKAVSGSITFFYTHLTIFIAIWAIFFNYLGQVKTVEDLSDPYMLLGIPEGSSKRVIKFVINGSRLPSERL